MKVLTDALTQDGNWADKRNTFIAFSSCLVYNQADVYRCVGWVIAILWLGNHVFLGLCLGYLMSASILPLKRGSDIIVGIDIPVMDMIFWMKAIILFDCLPAMSFGRYDTVASWVCGSMCGTKYHPCCFSLVCSAGASSMVNWGSYNSLRNNSRRSSSNFGRVLFAFPSVPVWLLLCAWPPCSNQPGLPFALGSLWL